MQIVPEEMKGIARVSSYISTAINSLLALVGICIVFVGTWFSMKLFNVVPALNSYVKACNYVIQTFIFNEVVKFALVVLFLFDEIKQIPYSFDFVHILNETEYYKISQVSNMVFIFLASIVFAYVLWRRDAILYKVVFSSIILLGFLLLTIFI